MLNAMGTRELVYVVKINSVEPIEGYDRVEYAHINGWGCVVPKGAFRAGDPGIYFEIDSKCPEVEPFLFLEKRKYHIKTQKMCKRVSQGLLMSAEDFGWTIGQSNVDGEVAIVDADGVFHNTANESRFLTKQIGVTYYEPADNARKSNVGVDKYKKMAQRHGKLFSKQPYKWLMKRAWGRKFLFVFYGKKKDKTGWPIWVKKTDEERLENFVQILNDKSPFIATEKVDGTSTTFTMKRGKFPWSKPEFYVCSRNVVFDKPDKTCFYDTNVYLEMAEKYKVEEALASYLKDHPEVKWVTLQGETYGPGVQKRDYGLDGHDFAGFNFITSTEGRWNSVRAAKFVTGTYGIPWVPILDENYVLPDTIEEVRAFSHSEGSRIDGVIKEGVVFRSQDGSISFKCVDPEFLLKYHG